MLQQYLNTPDVQNASPNLHLARRYTSLAWIILTTHPCSFSGPMAQLVLLGTV